MNDLHKTKAQLAAELARLRNRVTELEAANAARQQIEASLGHNRDWLLALSRAAQSVQRARTPDEIYRAVGEPIKALGFEATVFTLDQAAGNLILNYTTFAPAIIRAGEKLAGLSLQDYRLPLAPTSVYSRVLRTGQAEFTQSADEFVADALPATLRRLAGPLVRLLNIDRGIVAPLRVDEEPLGLLLMAASGVSPDDVPAMDSFAAQVAISLRNVRLAQQAQAELAARQQAEESSRLAEQRYRGLFENAPVMYAVTRAVDNQPIIEECNELFCRTLGFDRSELIGHPLADYYSPASRTQLVDSTGYQNALAGHFADSERELQTRAGRIITCILRSCALP